MFQYKIIDGFICLSIILPAPPIAKKSIACFVPSTCTSATSTFCNMTDIIPRGCQVTTTESPTTTTEQTTTVTESTTTKEQTKPTKAHCRRKYTHIPNEPCNIMILSPMNFLIKF